MWFSEDSSPENEHVTNLIEQLGNPSSSLRSQIVLMIRHLCGSFGLEVPVELATIDPQTASADHSHSQASGSKSRSSGPARMVKSFFNNLARKSRSKHEKACAGAGANADCAHSKPIPNSSASSSLSSSSTTSKACCSSSCAAVGSASGLGSGRTANGYASSKLEVMDVDERGRSEHEASAEASALEVAGARGESGESGAEGDEGEPDEPEPDAGEPEADDIEADLGSDGGDDPEPDAAMNASLGDGDFCGSPGPTASEEDAAHLDSTQLELIEKLKKRQYETNFTGVLLLLVYQF